MSYCWFFLWYFFSHNKLIAITPHPLSYAYFSSMNKRSKKNVTQPILLYKCYYLNQGKKGGNFFAFTFSNVPLKMRGLNATHCLYGLKFADFIREKFTSRSTPINYKILYHFRKEWPSFLSWCVCQSCLSF